MEEKTAELRDIFVDIADETTVTESQTAGRGSLLDAPAIRDRLADVEERMRSTYGFETDLDTDACCDLIYGFFDGATDAELAAELGVSADAVTEARLDLHLLRDADGAVEADTEALGACLAEHDPETCADRFDLDAEAVRRFVRARDARREAYEAGNAYRDEFELILSDADLDARRTESVREDGLAEATEDIETDVAF
jgi:hypothetical protein